MENPFLTLEARLDKIEKLLTGFSPAVNNPSTQAEKILTVEEAAAMLQLKKSTVYVLCCKGELPFLKRGKRSYFLETDLVAYLKAGRRKSNEELQKEATALLSGKRGIND